MYEIVNVSTQAELDAALARTDSPDVWLVGDGEFFLSDSSTVTASGSSTVTASGSSTVTAYDSSTVRASGSSTVTAYDSSTVRASGSSTVTASGSVAVHKLSTSATVTGKGHVIIPPDLTAADPATWLSYHGIEPDKKGVVILYKAVNDQWTTDRGADYSPGSKPKAADWNPNNECGGGLHFGPSPVHAMYYHQEATKFLACPVRVDEISVIDQQKVKARRVVGKGCVEVDLDGKAV